MKEIAYLDKKDTLKVSELLRKNRYMNLKNQISEVLKALGEKEIVSGIETGLSDGYYGLAYELSQVANKDIMWGLLNTNAVQAAVWHSDMTIDIIKTFNKDDWRRRIPKSLKESESFLRQIFDKNNIAQKAAVWDALNKSLITGASYQNTARSVKEAFDKGYKQALRVMRTEGHKATMIGELTASQHASEKGVDLQEFWMATRDLRTRPSHIAMDNKFKNEKGLFVMPSGITTSAPGITGIAEEDIHCRCAIGYVVDGIAPDERRVRGEVINVEKDYEAFVYELKTFDKKQENLNISKFDWFKDSVYKEHREYFEKAFKNMPKEAKDLWNKLGKNLQGEFYALKADQGYYNTVTNKIYLALDKPSSTYLYHKALGYEKADMFTFFHEAGHWFDNNLKVDNKPASSNIPNFKKLIREDFFAWVDSNIEKSIFKPKFDNYNSIQKLNDDYSFSAYLELEFKNNNKKFNHLLAGVSDIFGGISKNAVNGGFYHPTSYWKGDMLEQEAFASMFQALCFGGELDSLVGQYLPKSYAAFKEYLKGVI